MNEIIQTWFPVVTVLCSAGAIVFSMWMRETSKKEAEEVVSELKKEIGKELGRQRHECDRTERTVIDHDRRLIAVEKGLEAFPTSRDIKQLERQLSEISGKMEGMAAGLEGVKAGQERTESAILTINAALITPNLGGGGGR